MRKILIIGPGGAGKSTVARQLGKLLDIKVRHLDRLYWQPGWIASPKDRWLKTVDDLLRQEAWIIDGNYSGTLETRVQACDTVIFLDMPRLLCIARIFKRLMLYRNESRPDMAEGCREHFSFEFIRWVWDYSQRTRPKVIALLQGNSEHKQIFWLRSRAEVERFLQTILEPKRETHA